jgi:O-antigen biosynthesis protein
MAITKSGLIQDLSRESSRYAYVIPDYDQCPDVYSRTSILLEWVGTQKRVLELGCSTGFMSKYLMQKRHCSIVGVEIDASAAAQARDWCHEVLVRDLQNPNWISGLPERGFDVVLLADVLEHLIDPQALLKQVQPLLAQNASIIISLPNVVYWGNRLSILLGRFQYQAFGILDHTHLRFFTPKTARDMIEKAGYRITKFHPVFGGRLSGRARPFAQWLALRFPGLFAFQLLFEATAR